MLDKLASKMQDKKNKMKEQQLNSQQTNSIDVNQNANPNPPIDTGMINQRFGFNSAQNNPYSNGTGSARSNINPMAQNALQKFRQGMDMGDYMFNRQQAPAQAPAPLPGEAPIQGGDPNMGASAGVKPKKQAKREAKAYAAKHGLRGKAKKEAVKEAKKSQSFDPATNSKTKKIEESKQTVDLSGASMSDDKSTAAQRRKAAQDKAMGDNTTNKKGLGRAIEKIKDRNDVVSYTYENEKGGTTAVVTTKKKVRKEQRKIDKTTKDKPEGETKKPKATRSKSYKVPKSKSKSVYLNKKGKSLSMKKHKRRAKKHSFGASMNGGPGDERKKPTANIMQSDATRYEIPGTQQMKGEYAGLERRPASVDYPNMSKSEQRDIDYGRMQNEWLAKVSSEDHGFYSKAERDRQVHSLGYDITARPGPLNKNYGKTYEIPKEKPKSKTTQVKKTMAPNEQLKARKVVKKLEPKKKIPLTKMTTRPAQKLSTKKSGASMNGDNGYTYTTTDSKGYAKQKRKEDRKKKVSVSKSKVKKEYKGRESEWLPMSAYDTKRKQVKTKRADRMTKRGWKKDIYM